MLSGRQAGFFWNWEYKNQGIYSRKCIILGAIISIPTHYSWGVLIDCKGPYPIKFVELGEVWHAAKFFERTFAFWVYFFGREAEFFWRISLQISVKMHILMKDFTSTDLKSSCVRPPGRNFSNFWGQKSRKFNRKRIISQSNEPYPRIHVWTFPGTSWLTHMPARV
jgi:hypothetical protein